MFVESWLCEWVGNGIFRSALSEMKVLVVGMNWLGDVGGCWSWFFSVFILSVVMVICFSMGPR